MQSLFILISSVIALISPLVYTRAILKGEAKPHRTTRLVLLLITSLTTASLFAQHNQVAIWLAAVSTIQSVLIFILSIKYGMGGWEKADLLCLVIALIGILLWKITENPAIGLYFAIGADFMGVVPTLVKTYRFPKTEVWTFFLLDVFASAFSLMAVRIWTVDQFAYPIYIMLINLIIVLLIIRPQTVSKSKSTYF